MAHYLMQAKDSTTGKLIYWPAPIADYAGVDYPGPGTPVSPVIYGKHGSDPSLTQNVVTMTQRDIVTSDVGAMLVNRAAFAQILTVIGGVMVTGQRIDVQQENSGPTTIAEGANAQIRTSAGSLTLPSQFSGASIYCDDHRVAPQLFTVSIKP